MKARKCRTAASSSRNPTSISMKVDSTAVGREGVLKHGIYHLDKKLGVDESVMWGEYFFLESVSKVLSMEAI